MFGSLFRKAQATVDNAINQLVRTIIVALPFVVALGFATAAAAAWLVKEYGAENGHLILAGAYLALGLLAWAVIGTASQETTEPGATTTDEAVTPEAVGTASAASFGEADREMLIAALTSAAPVAIPMAARNLMRNLPLVLLLLAVAYVIAQTSQTGSASSRAGASPGEPAPAEG